MKFFHVPLFLVLFFGVNLFGQQLSKEQVNDTISRIPSFSMYQDNFMISGVPLHTRISKQTADVKYQISFKQLITRNTLPLDSYLFLTYTQKALWTVYDRSSPFEEINFNPGISLGKPVFNSDDELAGMAFLQLEHESNGRDSIYSRSWNSISLSFRASLNDRTFISLKTWYPFRYKKDNPDLFEYLGPGELNLHYDLAPEKLTMQVMLRKGLNWDWKGALRTRLLYRPFKMRSHHIMLEWFHGYAESLITYNEIESMIRLGIVFKSDDLNFLKPAPKQY